MLGETKNSRLDGKEDCYVEETIHSITLSIGMLFAITGCSSDSDAVAQANNKEIDWRITGTIELPD
jgi:hypothetical protein